MLDRLAMWWLGRQGYAVLPPLRSFKYEVSGPPSDTVTVDWDRIQDKTITVRATDTPDTHAVLRDIGRAARDIGRRGL